MTVALPVEVSVILPTYNERDNICDLIDAIRSELSPQGYPYEVIVVDDSSPDGTAEVVRLRYQLDAHDVASMPGDDLGHLRLFLRTEDKGLAKSIRDGLIIAHGQTLVVMDTDFNHDPAMIPQMVDLLRYYDLVIGSRFVMRGGMEDQLRYHFSQAYNVFIRALFQTQIQDNLSGYFAVRSSRWRRSFPVSTMAMATTSFACCSWPGAATGKSWKCPSSTSCAVTALPRPASGRFSRNIRPPCCACASPACDPAYEPSTPLRYSDCCRPADDDLCVEQLRPLPHRR
jgi:hypothetical protein